MLGRFSKYVEEMRKEFSKAAVFPRRFQAGCKARPVFLSSHITPPPTQRTLQSKRSRAWLFLNFPGKKTPKPKNYGEY